MVVRRLQSPAVAALSGQYWRRRRGGGHLLIILIVTPVPKLALEFKFGPDAVGVGVKMSHSDDSPTPRATRSVTNFRLGNDVVGTSRKLIRNLGFGASVSMSFVISSRTPGVAESWAYVLPWVCN